METAATARRMAGRLTTRPLYGIAIRRCHRISGTTRRRTFRGRRTPTPSGKSLCRTVAILVRVVSGDAAYFEGVFRTTVDGVLTVDGSPSSAARWVEGSSVVTVTDGRLTLRSGSGAVNNKLCFVKIWPQ